MRRNTEVLTRYEIAEPMNSNVICVLADRLSYRRRCIGGLIPTHISPRTIPPERTRFILEETRRDEFLIGKSKGSSSQTTHLL